MSRKLPLAQFRVPYQEPFSWPFFFHHLRGRVMTGVELATEEFYHRSIDIEGKSGLLTIRHDSAAASLGVSVEGPAAVHADIARQRIRSMFDLDTDLNLVHQHLGRDPYFAAQIAQFPWIRVPGPWSPFELLVRTIVGQQVTMKAATTILGRIVGRCGKTVKTSLGEFSLFPSPGDIADMDLDKIGMPGRRVATLQMLSQAIATGAIPFPGECGPMDGVRAGLLALPGIGPWTVEYFALRALRDGDAWPETDLILKRAVERLHPRSKSLALKRATRWRPWRGYAAMRLWYGSGPSQTPLQEVPE